MSACPQPSMRCSLKRAVVLDSSSMACSRRPQRSIPTVGLAPGGRGARSRRGFLQVASATMSSQGDDVPESAGWGRIESCPGRR